MTKNRRGEQRTVFWLPLSFTPDGIMIETFQGSRGVSGEIRTFESAVGMPVANFLRTEVENEAKRLGYKYVYIRRAEASAWYQRPVAYDEVKKSARGRELTETRGENERNRAELGALEEQAKDKIRSRMKKMIDGVAESGDYMEWMDVFRKTL